MRIVFIGSPDIAVPSLEAVSAQHQVVMVVTQPDRPQGRGQRVKPPPVKVIATTLGLPVLQPETLRGAALRAELAACRADVFVVVAYGKILSPKVLAIPARGCFNMHASLLPRFRGAAPIHWAVLRGETQSGVSIMKMDAGMDTGPVVLRRALELSPDETTGSLHDRLAPLGASTLLEALAQVAAGTASLEPQRDQQATLAPLLKKEDGRIDFSWPADNVDRWIRGMDPWPGAFTTTASGEPLRLFQSRATAEGGTPGHILTIDDRGALVACGAGAVWIRALQRAGKRRVQAQALAAGHLLAAGMHLGG